MKINTDLLSELAKELKADSQYHSASHHQWRALSIFCLYRLVIAASLAGVFQLNLGPAYLGSVNPLLYSFASTSYLLFAIVCPIGVRLRQPGHYLQIYIQVTVDIIAISLIMSSSGGISSGLGTLLAISVTSAGLLLGNTSALVFAAAATLALLGEQFLALLYTSRSQTAFTLSAIHGAVFFSTTLLAILLGARVRLSETLALKSEKQLERFRKLNEQVIQFMHTGVLIIDDDHRVVLKNEATDTLLPNSDHEDIPKLAELSPELWEVFKAWLSGSDTLQEISAAEDDKALLPSFRVIEEGSKSLYIIFLEDTTYIQQHAQNLKLASLGRLTGSIAHEIRNPLGAASHAAQLLSESEGMPEADKPLVEMIQRHCKRMNSIIESIMATSQRKPAKPSQLNLPETIESFIKDFNINRDPTPEFDIEIHAGNLTVSFDPNHLIQILTNLCENGIRYSMETVNKPYVRLEADFDPETGRVYLDVKDKGPGMSETVREKLFEPFFTTSHGGTGLGLYLSRGLCIANRAKMEVLPAESGACIRILFYKIG